MKRVAGALMVMTMVLSLVLPGAAAQARPVAPVADPPAPPAPKDAAPPVDRMRVMESFGRMPLYFIENPGQLDEQVAYYVQGSDKALYFAAGGVIFALTAPAEEPTPEEADRRREEAFLRDPMARLPERKPRSRWAVRLEFVGANPDVRPVGEEKLETIISYFKGPKEEWHTGLPTYSRIVYRDLWPGIDLVYHGTLNQLKYEFVVAPGADPGQIRLAYHGAESVALTPEGRLEVATPLGGLADDVPVAYQEVGGQRVAVGMAYALGSPLPAGEGTGVRSLSYGFALGAYDPALPLVLDPAILVYCGFIGGSGHDYLTGSTSIAVDANGNAYVAGYTESSESTFPVTGGFDTAFGGGLSDAFVAKIRADGTGLVYASFVGGSGEDRGYGIAVDAAGNAYVSGYTASSEATFPVSVGPDTTHNGGQDAFVAKVNPAGTDLAYAGFIGGSANDWGLALALDDEGYAYIVGNAQSSEASFPVSGGPNLVYSGGWDPFVAKVRADGTGLVYAGYVGGTADEFPQSIAVDQAHNAYITGWVTSGSQSSFPVTVGPDLSFNGGNDAFVAKVQADGAGLVYSGFIGGADFDGGYGIDVDAAGNAYVSGWTGSGHTSFPVAVGPDLTFNGSSDAFVAKVRADGLALDYAGYIGGSGTDQAFGIAVDRFGNAYIVGTTYSSEATFPVRLGPDLTRDLGSDGFVAMVRAGGTALVYAGYIGGNKSEKAYGIAVDEAGNAYVSGYVDTWPDGTFPVTVGPDLTYNGSFDAFVAKVALYLPHKVYLPLALRQP